MMNSLMLEVSQLHPLIIGWVTFLEVPRRNLLGLRISPHSDTVVPDFILTQSVTSPRAGAQHSSIHALGVC